jgi:hypothetical protein
MMPDGSIVVNGKLGDDVEESNRELILIRSLKELKNLGTPKIFGSRIKHEKFESQPTVLKRRQNGFRYGIV